jgi:hypothetical protein
MNSKSNFSLSNFELSFFVENLCGFHIDLIAGRKEMFLMGILGVSEIMI